MTQQVINIGAAPNDGTGDQLRVSFDKCNQNFTELYQKGAATASEGVWNFNKTSSDTSTSPVSGRFKTNSGDYRNATQIAIHAITVDGIDRSDTLRSLLAKDLIQVQDTSNGAAWARYVLQSVPTNNGTWFQLNVAWEADGNVLSGDNQEILFTFTANLDLSDIYMRWVPYTTAGQAFLRQDTTRDGDWSMVANKNTTDRPAPQATGAEEDLLPIWTPTTSSNPAAYTVYNEWTINTAGWIDQYGTDILTQNPGKQHVITLTVNGVVKDTFTTTPNTAQLYWHDITPLLILAGAVIRVTTQVSGSAGLSWYQQTGLFATAPVYCSSAVGSKDGAAAGTTAYGCHLLFTPGTASPDWDVLAYGGAAAGGGGGAAINSINGQLGPAVTIASGNGIGVTSASNTITIAGAAFTPTISGDVPASGGGTTNFLRADGTWAAAGGGASLTISATPPGSPTVGQMWWDSTGGQLYLWYDDGTSQQWVPATNAPVPTAAPQSGAWVKIQRIDLTPGQTAADFTTGLDLYDEYELSYINITLTASAAIALRVSIDGGSTWVSTNYQYFYYLGQIGSTPSGGANILAQTYVDLMHANSVAGVPFVGNTKFFTPSGNGMRKKFISTVMGINPTYGSTSTFNNAEWAPADPVPAINGVRIFTSSSSFSGGSIVLYGRVK